jgi:two-component system phosphate regulon sensor histidine kinase PhoR
MASCFGLVAAAAFALAGTAFAAGLLIGRRRARRDAVPDLGPGGGRADRGTDADSLSLRLAEMTARTNDRNNYVNSIFASIEDGLVVVDPAGQVVLFNPKASELLGLGPEVFFEDRAPEVLRREPVAAVLGLCANVSEHRVPEVRRLKAAQNRTFEVRIVPVADKYLGNRNFGSLAVVKDITELLRMENVKKDFVAAVSHEFRTPLTLISGFLELLKTQDGMDDRDRSRALEIMDLEAERLKRLVGELLALSEIGSDLPRDETEFDARTVIADAAESLRPLAERKGQAFTAELALPPCTLRGNESWFFLAVKNLLENAVKYTPDGGSVALTARRRGQFLEIRVADTGVGIAPEDRERIFERFYRVEKARGSGSGGSGLGLALARDAAAIFGGSVTVESEAGIGSTFTLTLPAAEWRTHDGA